MHLSDAGRMIQAAWDGLPIRFRNIELGEFTIMPNHMHGIIILTRRGEPCVRPGSCIRPDISPGSNDQSGDHKLGEYKIRPYGNSPDRGGHADRPRGTLPSTVGRIVQALKSITTHEYTKGVKQSGWPPFAGKLWRRNYWEHIIRDESELNCIREYIRNNPSQWQLDKLFVGANLVFALNLVFAPNATPEPSSENPPEAWMV